MQLGAAQGVRHAAVRESSAHSIAEAAAAFGGVTTLRSGRSDDGVAPGRKVSRPPHWGRKIIIDTSYYSWKYKQTKWFLLQTGL